MLATRDHHASVPRRKYIAYRSEFCFCLEIGGSLYERIVRRLFAHSLYGTRLENDSHSLSDLHFCEYRIGFVAQPEDDEDHLEPVVDVVQVRSRDRDDPKCTSLPEQTWSVAEAGAEVLLEDVRVLDAVKYGEQDERIDPGVPRIASD